MAANSSYKQIEAMIVESQPGAIFVPDDFTHFIVKVFKDGTVLKNSF